MFTNLIGGLPRWIPVAMAAALLFGTIGCARKPSGSGSGPAAPKIQELDAKEQEAAKVFGDTIETAIRNGDSARLTSMFDIDFFFRTLTAGIKIPKKPLSEFRSGFMEGYKKRPAGFFGEFIGSVATFREYRVIDDEPRLLFRIDWGEEGVNFCDFIVQPDKTGKMKVVDIFPYMTGEKISVASRRNSLPLLSEMSRSPLSKLLGRSTKFEETHLAAIGKMTESVRQGDHAAAMRAFESLSEEAQLDRTLLSLYLTAASSAEDDDAYIKAVERYRKARPEDDSLALLLIDYFYAKQDFPRAMEAVDDLEEFIGVKDAYLEFLRGGILMETGKFEEALEHMRQSIAMETDFESAYWGTVNIGLESSDFKTVSTGLDALAGQFELPTLVEDVESDAEYAGFLASEEGKAWLARQ